MAAARDLAMEVFAQTGSWVVFFREMLGATGVCTKLFPTPEERRYFESTEVYAELQEIIAVLRGQDPDKADAAEPEKVVTIRLPISLHQTLASEAETLNLSVNKLCISKLLQRIDRRFIPDQRGKVPGRKPGPQLSWLNDETDVEPDMESDMEAGG